MLIDFKNHRQKTRENSGKVPGTPYFLPPKINDLIKSYHQNHPKILIHHKPKTSRAELFRGEINGSTISLYTLPLGNPDRQIHLAREAGTTGFGEQETMDNQWINSDTY